MRSVVRGRGDVAYGLIFIGGPDLLASTVEKLRGWYLRTMRERGEEMTGTTAPAALGTLVDFLPDKERAALVRRFPRALEMRAKAAGVPLRVWVKELSDQARHY